MIIPYKMTCFHPCHILPWYVTESFPAFFCPPFLLLAGKDRRHETFPHFLYIFDKACEDRLKRGGVPFFSNRQPTKCNSFSAPERSPFPQRPDRYCTFFETHEMNVVREHQEQIQYCKLHLRLAGSILTFSFIL